LKLIHLLKVLHRVVYVCRMRYLLQIWLRLDVIMNIVMHVYRKSLIRNRAVRSAEEILPRFV
jgi:hypothetical protein